MSRKIVSFEKLNGRNLKIGVIRSRWSEEITAALLVGALKAFAESGVNKKNIITIDVTGTFELPMAAQKVIKQKKVDAVLVLGCVIKGETPHDEYIAHAASQGIMRVALDTGVPVIFGVLTCLNEQQAVARSTGQNNHGYFWGKTAVEMGLLKKKKF